LCASCGADLSAEPPAEDPAANQTETMPAPIAQWTTGRVFAGRYQIVEEIGRGGMGRVYKVVDSKIGEPVALKIIAPEIAADPRVLERFRQELKLARQVTHRNVCRVFDLGEAEGTAFLTMEYCSGDTLKSVIGKAGVLDIRTAVDYARQICDGLAEAHKTGIIHRDLKPQNLIVDDRQRIRIMDFGIARTIAGGSSTREGVMIGTPEYMAPEQIEGSGTDQRTDLYALGVILYEMTTGHVPFAGRTSLDMAFKHKNEAPRPPASANPLVSESLDALILRCLEKDKTRRYPSAEAVRAGLDAIAAEFGPAGTPRPAPGVRSRPAPLPLRRFAILAGAAGLVLVAAVILFLILFRNRDQPEPGEDWSSRIAVLPLRDLSPTKSLDNLASLIKAGLRNKVHALPSLALISEYSCDRFKETTNGLAEIGRTLGARYILGGSLDFQNGRLILFGSLGDAETGADLINQRYEEAEASVLEERFVQDVAARLDSRVQDGDFRKVQKRVPASLDAFQDWKRGDFFQGQYRDFERDEDFEEAKRLYLSALAHDPNYVFAYCSLGDLFEARFVKKDRPADLAAMAEHYETAYRMDENLAESQVGKGWTYFYREDPVESIRYFRRGHTLDPDNSRVLLGVGAFLRSIGLYEEAIAFFAQAAKSDPLSPSPLLQMASCCWYLGDFAKAIEILAPAKSLAPNSARVAIQLARQHLGLGAYDLAAEELALVKDPEGLSTSLKRSYNLGRAWLAAGRRDRAEFDRLVQSTDRPFAYEITSGYCLLGLREDALRNVREGIERGMRVSKDLMYTYEYLARNPVLRNLRSEPEFQKILAGQKARYEETIVLYAGPWARTKTIKGGRR
jgi:serine/threonine protein kinase